VKPFRATSAGVVATFDRTDARLLANLATQVAGLLTERDEHVRDPALERLLPAAYRDSDEDAAEFRRFTEEELAGEKVRSALAMAELLTPDTGPDDGVRIVLDRASALDWMRSLTDIRLAIAARLGIVDETSPIDIDDESRYTLAIYDWLGQLQYWLVKAVDR
jgi:hypothetical protein